MSTEQEKLLNKTETGQKVVVDEHRISNRSSTHANEKLRRIGMDLQENFATDAVKYMGSSAVHIYQSEMLGTVFFISQVETLQGVPEVMASNAFARLRGDQMELFGRERQKKRSGF